MRHDYTIRALLAGLMGLVATTTAVAQQIDKPTLFVCGYYFALSSTLEGDLAKIADSSECMVSKIKAEDAGSPTYLLVAKHHPDVVFGELLYKGNRLALVTREWAADVRSGADYGRVLIGLLRKLEAEGHTTCKITTSLQNDPTSDLDAAYLICGPKRIQLLLTDYGTGGKSIQITEMLGDPV